MFLRRALRLLPSVTFFAASAALTVAAPVRDKHVEAELVAESAALVPGRTATVALRLKHDPHWHTYWVNAGDAGLPTTLAWTLPAGFSAGAIQWPLPHVLNSSGILTYGYGDEILLLVDLAVSADAAPGTTVKLAARAEWLMCQEACIPGKADLALELPVAALAPPDARWAAPIAAARAALARADGSLAAEALRDAKQFRIRVAAARGALDAAVTKVAFFSADGAVDALELQPAARRGDRIEFTVPLAAAAGDPTKLAGLLVADAPWIAGGQKAVVVEIPVVAAGAAAAPGANAGADGAKPAASAGTGLAGVLGLAFVGGLILNLMPCVFPVLGIKILGFVQQAGEDARRVKLHGLAYTFGVLVSFWVLAGILLALRPATGGSEVGWGYQLQIPGFVFAVAAVMLVFALSLSGVFEIGGSLIGTGANLQAKRGLSGSFFSGVLATVVATPCSAPFLGVALTAALTLPAAQSVLVFTVIALGLAVPYLLFSIFPRLVKVLPRPGAWMETFKQFMAFPLYATVGYLLWVLAAQAGEGDALLLVMFGLTLVAMAAWVYGRWAAPHRNPRTRWLGRLAALGLLAGGGALGWPQTQSSEAATAAGHLDWQPWSEAAVAKLRAEGRTVYVDFTARWCVTCQVNKKVVFTSQAVLDAFSQGKVATLRADWTNRDSKITAELARHGRAAVPTNLVYLPGRADPILLPEALTPGTVLDALRSR